MTKLSKRSIEFLNNIYLKNLQEFYDNFENVEELLTIIQSKNKISLRLIDWIITKYTKYHLTLLQNKNQEMINVYISYKSQLKVYTKKFFDPFKRGIIVDFKFNNDQYVKTTVGQLMFFKWIYENNIYDFIVQNHEDLNTMMNNYYLMNKKKKINKAKFSNQTKSKNNKKFNNVKQIDKYFIFTFD